jgi:DNA primase small subunit
LEAFFPLFSTFQNVIMESYPITWMSTYYSECFPVAALVDWLSYGDEKNLQSREFALFCTDRTDQVTILHRSLSFHNRSELRQKLLGAVPSRFEIGAAYKAGPSKLIENPWDSKELVFDIDASDYNDVRKCCKDKQLCRNCWNILHCAILILDRTLRDDLGFDHLLWVYSGRRGVHCWVCDQKARYYSKEARVAILSYLSFRKFDNMDNPVLQRAYKIALPWFEACLESGTFELTVQALEEDEKKKLPPVVMKRWLELQQLDKESKHNFKNPKSYRLWTLLKQAVQSLELETDRTRITSSAPLRSVLQKVVLSFIHPRLDEKVTSERAHLVKAPFCVHPSTGRVCVPLDPSALDTFDVSKVPTLKDLMEERIQIQRKHKTQALLQPALEIFQAFLTHLFHQPRVVKRKVDDLSF